MHNSPGYVWWKMLVAVGTLCSSGKWTRRLSDAALVLITLTPDDLDGELGEKLRFVLKWTVDNLEGGRVKKLPRTLDRSRLIDTMIHILLETDRIEVKALGE